MESCRKKPVNLASMEIGLSLGLRRSASAKTTTTTDGSRYEKAALESRLWISSLRPRIGERVSGRCRFGTWRRSCTRSENPAVVQTGLGHLSAVMVMYQIL